MSETIWKKKKPKRNVNNNVNNNYDGPYGEILFNLQRPDIKPVFEKNDDVKINEGFVEGASFEIFPDTKAYYNNCKSFFNGLQTSNKKKIMNSIINMLVSPFSHVDEAIKNFLLYLIQPPTEEKTDVDDPAKSSTDWNFFWTSRDERVYTENFQEGLKSQNIQIEFSNLDQFLSKHDDTINSILKNHPWIEQHNLYYNLCEYYAEELKKDYDIKINNGSSYSTEDLYHFSDNLNNALDNEDKYLKILRNVILKWSKSTKSTTTPSGSAYASTTTETPKTKKSNPIDPNILKDVKVIKEFIYQILLVPVYFYVAYNFYFLMYFRKDNSSDENGNLKKLGCELNEFPNWDTIFDNSFTGLITEFIFKPTKIFPIFFNAFKYFLPNYGVNKLTPYISFFLSISIVVALLNGLFPTIFKILVDFLWDFKIDLGLYIYCSIIIWLCFALFLFRDAKKTLDGVKSTGGGPPPSYFSLVMMLLSKLIYYIIKGAFTYMIIPMSTMVFVIYFLYIMFFSIGDFKNIQYINQYIYSNLFDTNPIDENIFGEKDHDPQKFNSWIKPLNVYIDKIRLVFNPIFTFLFEFILCMLYLTYYNNSYSRINSDKAPNIKTAFVIISILFFVLMSIWIFGYKMPNLYKPNDINVAEPDPTCEYKNTEKVQYSIITCITDEFNREEELIQKKKQQLKNKIMSSIPSIPIPSIPSIPSFSKK